MKNDKLKFLSNIQVKLPGIYGGMGPMSHVVFEQALIAECIKRGIDNDQDYPVWIVASGSSTPDRTRSIAGGESSLLHMNYFCKTLENAGSDFIVLICNTAHFYLAEIQQNLNIPTVSMIEETAKFISNKYPHVSTVGILATEGALKTKLYHDAIEAVGLIPVSFGPKNYNQKNVMDAIYDREFGIKATGNSVSKTAIDKLTLAVNRLTESGAKIIIAGCTEISLALKHLSLGIPIVDPIEILAEKVIDTALGTIELEKSETVRNFPSESSLPFYNFPNETSKDFLEF